MHRVTKNFFPLTQSGVVLGVFLNTLLAITSENTAPSYGMRGDVLEAVHAVGLGVLLGLYGLAVLRLRHGWLLAPRHLWLSLALFAAPYALNFATQSTDIYNYIAYAEISQDTSPYLQGPASLGLEHPIVHGIWEKWRPFPSPYGPVWTLIGNAVGTLHASLATQLLLYKLFGAIIFGAIVGVLLRWSPKNTGILVALNPIFIIEFVGDAHNDGLFTFAVLLAVVSYARPLFAGASTGLSIVTKHLSLVLSPIFLALYLRARAFRKAGIYAASIISVVGLAYASIWQGRDTFTGVLAVLPDFYAVPLFFPQKIFYALLRDFNAELPLLVGLRSAAVVGLAIYLLIQFWIYWRVFRGRLSLHASTFMSFCALIFFGMQWVQPWYLTWPLVLTAFLQPKYATKAIAALTIIWFASKYTTF